MSQLHQLLRANPLDLTDWLINPSGKRIAFCLATTLIGFSLYGLTVGLWRAPLMGAYVALKMPLLIFLTLLCNGLLNGIFGLLLGSGLGFRQSLLALLMSFSIAAAILGSLAPVTFFLALNAPEVTADTADNARTAHSAYLLTHTLLIAGAGLIANAHLARLLIAHCPDRKIAALTLSTWVGGNAFVGAQFSWILRPFFGSPNLTVAFLREDPMHGTFYEAVWRSLDRISGGNAFSALLLFAFGFLIILTPLISLFKETNPKKQKNHEANRPNH